MASSGWSWVDAVLAALVLGAAVSGYRKGLAAAALALGKWLLSLFLAGRLAAVLAGLAYARWQVADRLLERLNALSLVPAEAAQQPADSITLAAVNQAAHALGLPAAAAPISRRILTTAQMRPEGTVAEVIAEAVTMTALEALGFGVALAVLLSVFGWLAGRLARRCANRKPDRLNRALGGGTAAVAAVLAIVVLAGQVLPLLALSQAATGGAAPTGRLAGWLAPVQEVAAAVAFGTADPGLAISRNDGLRVLLVDNPDSPVTLAAADRDGAVMVLLHRPGGDPLQIEHVILQGPDGPAGLFHLGPDGKVAALEAAGHRLTFANYTATTVDVALHHPDGRVEEWPAAPYAPGGQPADQKRALNPLGPGVAYAGAASGSRVQFLSNGGGGLLSSRDPLEIRLILTTTATFIGGASCTAALIGAAGTGGALSPLAAIGCTSHLITSAVAIGSLVGDAPEPLTQVPTVLDAELCGLGDIGSCAAVVLNKIAELMPSWQVVYTRPTLTLQVLDKLTGDPILWAPVTVYDQAGKQVFASRTDWHAPRLRINIPPRGVFSYRNMSDGSYRFVVAKPGYTAAEYTMEVRPDRIRIHAQGVARPVLDQDWRDLGGVFLRISLEPDTGFYPYFKVVAQDTGQPLAGARVTVSTTAGRLVTTALTRAAAAPGKAGTEPGQVGLQPLTEGGFLITVAKDGFATQTFRMAVTHDRVRIVTEDTRQPVVDQQRQESAIVRMTVALQPETEAETPAAAEPPAPLPAAAEPAEPQTGIAAYVGQWNGRVASAAGDEIVCGWNRLVLDFYIDVSDSGRVIGAVPFPVGDMVVDAAGVVRAVSSSASINLQLDADSGRTTGTAEWTIDQSQCKVWFTLRKQ